MCFFQYFHTFLLCSHERKVENETLLYLLRGIDLFVLPSPQFNSYKTCHPWSMLIADAHDIITNTTVGKIQIWLSGNICNLLGQQSRSQDGTPWQITIKWSYKGYASWFAPTYLGTSYIINGITMII